MMLNDFRRLEKKKKKEEDLANGEAKPKKRKRVKKFGMPVSNVSSEATPVEMTKTVIASKLAPKISKKINYAALDSLFGTPGM
jgi:hypothetical protein